MTVRRRSKTKMSLIDNDSAFLPVFNVLTLDLEPIGNYLQIFSLRTMVAGKMRNQGAATEIIILSFH
jgi:hypothetical protein